MFSCFSMTEDAHFTLGLSTGCFSISSRLIRVPVFCRDSVLGLELGTFSPADVSSAESGT